MLHLRRPSRNVSPPRRTSENVLQEIPSIATARLTLRGHGVDDYGESAAMWSDAEVVRHISGTPSTPQQAWNRLLAYAGHWRLLDFGYWVVRETVGDAFVGEVGFADFKRDLHPSLAGIPEIGWALSPAAHGRGYATEAVAAALRWGDDRGWPTTYCIIKPENDASLRVAEKVGYRESRRLTYAGTETIVFERSRGATPARSDR